MKTIDEALHTRIEAFAAKYREAILSIPGVTDVGVGYRQKNRALTEEPALVVRVARKFDLAKLPEHARLPASIEGVPVDVQEVHQTPHLERRQRADALLGGLAIQNVKRGGWGTLGAIVKDRATGTAPRAHEPPRPLREAHSLGRRQRHLARRRSARHRVLTKVTATRTVTARPPPGQVWLFFVRVPTPVNEFTGM